MDNIAIYGAGGYGRETACLLRALNDVEPQWNLIGFFDDNLSIKGTSNTFGKIIGGAEVLNMWDDRLAVVMAIANPKILESLVSKIKNPNIYFPNILAPDILLFDKNNFTLEQGNLIGFRCVLSTNVRLGSFNLFNNDITIGHDTVIGNFNIFYPSVRISGEASIGNKNFFGVSSIILQQKKIGNNTLVAPNSVIIRNTADNSKYIGNPAIKINI